MPYNPSEAVERFKQQFTDEGELLVNINEWDVDTTSEDIEQFLLSELTLCRQQVLSEVEEWAEKHTPDLSRVKDSNDYNRGFWEGRWDAVRDIKLLVSKGEKND